MNRYKLIGYSQSFLSFLFSDDVLWSQTKIKNIVLFGSVARGDFAEDSDIDIFFEVSNENDIEFVKRRINYVLSQFLSSDINKQWKLRGVNNEIRSLIGTLNKTSDLGKSLVTDGIVLFGSFEKETKKEHYTLISFDPIENKNKRYRIDRYLFGRKEKNRKSEGIIKFIGGIKIDNRTFLLPSIQSKEIIYKFKKEKVDFILYDIWM